MQSCGCVVIASVRDRLASPLSRLHSAPATGDCVVVLIHLRVLTHQTASHFTSAPRFIDWCHLDDGCIRPREVDWSQLYALLSSAHTVAVSVPNCSWTYSLLLGSFPVRVEPRYSNRPASPSAMVVHLDWCLVGDSLAGCQPVDTPIARTMRLRSGSVE